MKVLRNKVNEVFSEAMKDVVHVFKEMKVNMKKVIKDGEFSPEEMMEVLGEPISLIENLSNHQTTISKHFDDAESRLSSSKKKKLWG